MGARFITLRAFILRWKRVCIAHNNCMSCPSCGQLYLHCSLIYFWVPSSCFCAIDQPLSLRVKIIPFSSVSSSRGRLHYPRRKRGGFTHWLTNCFDVQPTTTSGMSRRASFSALASANSFVYFASSAATSRWRICVSVIAAFASFSSLAFLSRWAL